MAKKKQRTTKSKINTTTGVSRIDRHGRNKKGQALSRSQRRRNVYAATRTAAGLSAG